MFTGMKSSDGVHVEGVDAHSRNCVNFPRLSSFRHFYRCLYYSILSKPPPCPLFLGLQLLPCPIPHLKTPRPHGMLYILLPNQIRHRFAGLNFSNGSMRGGNRGKTSCWLICEGQTMRWAQDVLSSENIVCAEKAINLHAGRNNPWVGQSSSTDFVPNYPNTICLILRSQNWKGHLVLW